MTALNMRTAHCVRNVLFAACAAITLMVVSLPASAQSPQIAPDRKYLGNLNSNPYDPNSVSNPYGQYGSPLLSEQRQQSLRSVWQPLLSEQRQ